MILKFSDPPVKEPCSMSSNTMDPIDDLRSSTAIKIVNIASANIGIMDYCNMNEKGPPTFFEITIGFKMIGIKNGIVGSKASDESYCIDDWHPEGAGPKRSLNDAVMATGSKMTHQGPCSSNLHLRCTDHRNDNSTAGPKTSLNDDGFSFNFDSSYIASKIGIKLTQDRRQA
jgi:hypothetical protein